MSALTRTADELITRDWDERAKALDQARKRLRSGWRNDDEVLEQYFQSCVDSWKKYSGPRRPKAVLKLQAVYKQALIGDCNELPPDNLKSVEGVKWSSWNALKGMDKSMAKRRFITLLSEIDPLIIDVMPDEKPPMGFPFDRSGHPICAKCNTKVGCTRPLLDERQGNLKQQLFGDPELYDPNRLREWIRNALKNQRCVWGLHKAIQEYESIPFSVWFNRKENQGFMAYDNGTIMLMLKDLLVFNCELAVEMQNNKDDYEQDAIDTQGMRLFNLKTVYEEFTGTEFTYEVECDRDVEMCNRRRFADGGKNHTHAIVIELPKRYEGETYQEAIELRKECQRLGLALTTGVVTDVKERCEIYKKRIAEHLEAIRKAAEAKERNDSRAEVHKGEKLKVKSLTANMVVRQCWDACHAGRVDRVLDLVRRGCNPNEESPRGATPLICLLLREATTEQVEALLKKKASPDYVNKYGMTGLMLACRMKDMKLIHVLMRGGASVYRNAGSLGGGKGARTALHWCVLHGAEEEAKVLADYVKDSGGDALRMVRFLDSQSEDGTPLMLAARRRNAAMCLTLIAMGANPSIRNREGKNAGFIARNSGWQEVADWLDKKVGSGMANTQTYSDVQFDRKVRYGSIKLRDLLDAFVKAYLQLIMNTPTLVPLGNTSLPKVLIAEYGDRARRGQQEFVDRHQLMIHYRDHHDHEVEPDEDPQEIHKVNDDKSSQTTSDEAKNSSSTVNTARGAGGGAGGMLQLDVGAIEERKAKEKRIELRRAMRKALKEMYDIIKSGTGNPNIESFAKPLAWVPLMCAVAINDIPYVKRFLREGCDPNQPNKFGTTPLMLAAQLNNNAVMVELLEHGGDLSAVDSEGCDVLAYAGSLPLPKCMNPTIVTVLTDGKSESPRRMPAMDLLKIGREKSIEQMKEVFMKNMKACTMEAIGNHYKQLQLLQKFGLTHVETQKQVRRLADEIAWRLPPSEEEQARIAFEARERQKLMQSQEEQERIQAEEEAARSAAVEPVLRCPICTLPPPCGHFFKKEVLQSYFNKIEGEVLENAVNEEDIEKAREEAKEKLKLGLGIAKAFENKLAAQNHDHKARVRVMAETELNDRHTDRNWTFVKKYKYREADVKQQLLLEYEEKKLQKEQLDAIAWASGMGQIGHSGQMGQIGHGDQNGHPLQIEYPQSSPTSASSTIASTSASASASVSASASGSIGFGFGGPLHMQSTMSSPVSATSATSSVGFPFGAVTGAGTGVLAGTSTGANIGAGNTGVLTSNASWISDVQSVISEDGSSASTSVAESVVPMLPSELALLGTGAGTSAGASTGAGASAGTGASTGAGVSVGSTGVLKSSSSTVSMTSVNLEPSFSSLPMGSPGASTHGQDTLHAASSSLFSIRSILKKASTMSVLHGHDEEGSVATSATTRKKRKVEFVLPELDAPELDILTVSSAPSVASDATLPASNTTSFTDYSQITSASASAGSSAGSMVAAVGSAAGSDLSSASLKQLQRTDSLGSADSIASVGDISASSSTTPGIAPMPLDPTADPAQLQQLQQQQLDQQLDQQLQQPSMDSLTTFTQSPTVVSAPATIATVPLTLGPDSVATVPTVKTSTIEGTDDEDYENDLDFKSPEARARILAEHEKAATLAKYEEAHPTIASASAMHRYISAAGLTSYADPSRGIRDRPPVPDPIGPNPVPREKRRFFMFIHKATEAATKRMMSPGRRDKDREPVVPIIELPGWLFLAPTTLDRGQPPVARVKLPQREWGEVLEHVRQLFFREWCPRMTFQPLVDEHTFKPLAPRCVNCLIGYARLCRPANAESAKPSANTSAYDIRNNTKANNGMSKTRSMEKSVTSQAGSSRAVGSIPATLSIPPTCIDSLVEVDDDDTYSDSSSTLEKAGRDTFKASMANNNNNNSSGNVGYRQGLRGKVSPSTSPSPSSPSNASPKRPFGMFNESTISVLTDNTRWTSAQTMSSNAGSRAGAGGGGGSANATAVTAASTIQSTTADGTKASSLRLDEDTLCLPCLVRRAVYEKVKSMSPSELSDVGANDWPFLVPALLPKPADTEFVVDARAVTPVMEEMTRRLGPSSPYRKGNEEIFHNTFFANGERRANSPSRVGSANNGAGNGMRPGSRGFSPTRTGSPAGGFAGSPGRGPALSHLFASPRVASPGSPGRGNIPSPGGVLGLTGVRAPSRSGSPHGLRYTTDDALLRTYSMRNSPTNSQKDGRIPGGLAATGAGVPGAAGTGGAGDGERVNSPQLPRSLAIDTSWRDLFDSAEGEDGLGAMGGGWRREEELNRERTKSREEMRRKILLGVPMDGAQNGAGVGNDAQGMTGNEIGLDSRGRLRRKDLSRGRVLSKEGTRARPLSEDLPAFEELVRRSPIASREVYEEDVVKAVKTLDGLDPDADGDELAEEYGRYRGSGQGKHSRALPGNGFNGTDTGMGGGPGGLLENSMSEISTTSSTQLQLTSSMLPGLKTSGVLIGSKMPIRAPVFPGRNPDKKLLTYNDPISDSDDDEDEGGKKKGADSQSNVNLWKDRLRNVKDKKKKQQKDEVAALTASMEQLASKLSKTPSILAAERAAEEARIREEKALLKKRWARMQGVGIGSEEGDDPPELALALLLVTKGNIDEAERILRFCINEQQIDEGAGLRMLIKVLTVQAEIYRRLGLWPLALGLYMDCADMSVALVGPGDTGTVDAMALVTRTLRRMQGMDPRLAPGADGGSFGDFERSGDNCRPISDSITLSAVDATFKKQEGRYHGRLLRENVAKHYVEGYCRRLESVKLAEEMLDHIDAVRAMNSFLLKKKKLLDALWLDHIAPLEPEREYYRRGFYIHGLAGLYHCYTSTRGFHVAMKTSFLEHCRCKDSDYLGDYAAFVIDCFVLRDTEDSEIRQYLLQQLVLKYLRKPKPELADSKSPAKPSAAAAKGKSGAGSPQKMKRKSGASSPSNRARSPDNSNNNSNGNSKTKKKKAAVIESIYEMYQRVTPVHHIEKLQEATQLGADAPSEILDDALFTAMCALVKEFRWFLYATPAGKALYMESPYEEDVAAEVVHLNALLVQNEWRAYLARQRVREKYREIADS